jgi:hypothetical protein
MASLNARDIIIIAVVVVVVVARSLEACIRAALVSARVTDVELGMQACHWLGMASKDPHVCFVISCFTASKVLFRVVSAMRAFSSPECRAKS